MGAEEHQRWTQQTRFQQLAIAEAKAWKRFAWGTGIYIGLILLFMLGILIAGSPLSPAVRPNHGGVVWFVGTVLRGISGIFLFLLAMPLMLRFVRWVEAMWQRRRFSSTPGADPGQPQRR